MTQFSFPNIIFIHNSDLGKVRLIYDRGLQITSIPAQVDCFLFIFLMSDSAAIILQQHECVVLQLKKKNSFPCLQVQPFYCPIFADQLAPAQMYQNIYPYSKPLPKIIIFFCLAPISEYQISTFRIIKRKTKAFHIQDLFLLLLIIIQILKSSMSQQPKLPPPPMPYRFPFPYPPMIPEKLKGTQPIPGSNPIPPTSIPPNNNIPGAPPYMPPRLYNPYLGGYNMFPMGQHFPPYMPLGRNMPPPTDSQENSKNQKIGEEKNGPVRPPFPRPGPPFFNPGMYYPPPFPNFPMQHSAHEALKPPIKNLSQETSISHPEPAMKKEIKTVLIPPQLLTQQPIREQPKPKVKEVRHADVKAYEPEGPSKKKKKEIIVVQNRSQRETREKKQSIEKIMDVIMRQRPLRDRIIKIGKEHQAVIPESFINEYEYNLKIKLQKKKSLLSRLVISV